MLIKATLIRILEDDDELLQPPAKKETKKDKKELDIITKSTIPRNMATVSDVAKAAKCSSHTVRVLADRGLVSMKKDYNGWRRFPDLAQSVQDVQQHLYPESTQ